MNILSYIKATYLTLYNLVINKARKSQYVLRYNNDDCNTLTARIQYLLCDPIEIVHNLYLGNSFHAANMSLLQDNRIDTIINVTDNIPNYFENYFTYYKINIHDLNGEYFGDELRNTFNLIKTKLAEGKRVMVHCVEGRSRSVTIIIYYLMNELDYSFDDAYLMIKNKKSIVNLNQTFVVELNQFPRVRAKSIDDMILVTS